MLNAIAKPFGAVFMWFYQITGNYGIALLLFALLVRLIMLPFQMKSKRSTLKMTRAQPIIQDLQKRYANNKQKLNDEMSRFYRENGIKPLSGCIWNLIPFPIIIALYQAIRKPLTLLMGLNDAEMAVITEKLNSMGFTTSLRDIYVELDQSQFISQHWDSFTGISDKLKCMDYSFLGMDLGRVPQWKFWQFGAADDPSLWGLFLIPIIAAGLTFLSSVVSMKSNGQNEQTQSMKAMIYFMPFMTLYFAFIMPASIGIYWAASTFFALLQELTVGRWQKHKLDLEYADWDAKMRAREEDLERKREEYEKKRAENATVANPNTSKKKQSRQERQQKEQNAREWDKKNSPDAEDNPSDSRVGDRRYARGRAYVADRYSEDYVPREEPAPAEDETEPEAEVPEETQDVSDDDDIVTLDDIVSGDGSGR
ncbi:MAG: membrane protein insertase YidC [Oscillospiraceae bacterium]|nr:membrane protein insertase YidC [Oscillospiraceae bacterium]